MNKKKIIFLTNANNKIGFGHINRVLILAKLFKKKNYNLFIFGVKKKFIKNKNLFSKIIEESPLNNKNFNFSLINKHLNYKDCFFIIDTYQINSVVQKILYDKKIKWLQFDNMNAKNKKMYATVIVNSNPITNRSEYKNRIKHNNYKLLLGSKYILVRDEFEKIKNNNYKNKIFISSGGGAKDNGMIELVLKKLLKITNNQKIIIIINKSNSSLKNIKKIAKMNKNIEIFSNTNKISNLMSQAKIFITSGGNTLIESLMFKGLRFVISTADNQILQCKSWSKLKLINYLGHITEKKKINNKIDKFFKNINFKLIKKLNSKNFIYEKYRFLDAIKERY